MRKLAVIRAGLRSADRRLSPLSWASEFVIYRGALCEIQGGINQVTWRIVWLTRTRALTLCPVAVLAHGSEGCHPLSEEAKKLMPLKLTGNAFSNLALGVHTFVMLVLQWKTRRYAKWVGLAMIWTTSAVSVGSGKPSLQLTDGLAQVLTAVGPLANRIERDVSIYGPTSGGCFFCTSSTKSFRPAATSPSRPLRSRVCCWS